MAKATSTGEQNSALEARYGTGRRSRLDRKIGYTVAGLLVFGALVFLLFSGWQRGTSVAWQDISYKRTDDSHVQVRYEVSAPSDQSVACAVKALDKSKGVVGWKVLPLPAPHEGTYTVTTTLVTTGKAVAGTVHTCWEVSR